MKTYNIIDIHPIKPYLIIDDDFADYLREQSFDLDLSPMTALDVIELFELLDAYIKEES